MPRTEHDSPITSHPERYLRVALAAGAALVLAIAGTYVAEGEWDTAAGVLTGAALAGLLVPFASWRARRSGAEAATASRVFGGVPDERDAHVYRTALAAVGLTAILLSALAPVAVELGLDALTVVKFGPYAFLVVGAAAFTVVNKRS